jgi:hypothetical protein
MAHLPRTTGFIHPSIDGLVEMIRAQGKGSAEEVTQLRELCKRKMRSYREDVFLKRYTVPSDIDAARERWNIVSSFANR